MCTNLYLKLRLRQFSNNTLYEQTDFAAQNIIVHEKTTTRSNLMIREINILNHKMSITINIEEYNNDKMVSFETGQ